MTLTIGILLFIALVLLSLGLAFIYAWHRAPSTYEGSYSAETAAYLRRSDLNALLGALFVFWSIAAGLVIYSVYTIRSG